MSAHQTQLRTNRYHQMLVWFMQQPQLAPINIVHFNLLWTIYQFLISNVDIWGSPEVQALCVVGDNIVALYDRPTDVVDLTLDEDGAVGGGGPADDSGMAEN
jgi:hypothetical protein